VYLPLGVPPNSWQGIVASPERPKIRRHGFEEKSWERPAKDLEANKTWE
jgi:hypothetical protein